MGSDKALLRHGDTTLLQRALATASVVASRAVIVGSAQRYADFGEVVEDIYPGCGPLGGIHAALSATLTDRNLVLSVDMPHMQADFLLWLLQQSAASREQIVVPDVLGQPQPLCAVYRREVAVAAEQALAQGEYKVRQLFAAVPTRRIAEDEIIAAGFSPSIFTNLNTSQDYERLTVELPAERREQESHQR